MNNNANKINYLSSIGNFTKNAVKNFEQGIVNEHNYLEKVDKSNKNERG